MIECAGLGKHFGSTLAVDSVSFSVNAGEVVGFLGPNGAGKSTTMRMLAGFLTPDSGTAKIAGHDVVIDRADAQAQLGYMPEAAAGFGNLTVYEFLLFCGQSRGLSRGAASDAIERIAERISLRAALGRIIRDLSKGWRQRAWFAQAVLHDPQVLIFDEPTDGLDPKQKTVVRDYIREISGEKAIILSTHILEEAEVLCDRVIVIDAGKIVADTPTASLLDGKGRLATAFDELTQDRPVA